MSSSYHLQTDQLEADCHGKLFLIILSWHSALLCTHNKFCMEDSHLLRLEGMLRMYATRL